MTQQLPVVIGMVWYKPEHYGAILGIMTDSNHLPRTFHEWRMKAETGEKQRRRAGQIVVRAFIDPETFPDWCRAKGLNVDAQARVAFANEIAHDYATRRHHEAGGMH